jgi:AraC-like DNA-binding protein
MRMNNVRVLLSETRLSLQEISNRTGFGSQSYLAARFKK